jgi:hypothetical protein
MSTIEQINSSLELMHYKTNHVLHLLMTVFTAGLWVCVWIFVCASNTSKRNQVRTAYGFKKESNISKFIIGLAFVLIVLMAVGSKANAGSANDIEKNLTAIANFTVTTYKDSGMSGLESIINDCYSMPKKTPNCIYMDLSAMHIDDVVAGSYLDRTGKNIHSEYFTVTRVATRIKQSMSTTDLSVSQQNDYLQTIAPIINELTDQSLLK